MQPTLTNFVRDFDRSMDLAIKEFDDGAFFLDMPRISERVASLLSEPSSIEIDVKESPREYTLTADVPAGTDKDNLHVSVRNGRIEISSERKSEKDAGDSNYIRQERFYGKVSRNLQLPDNADENKISGSYSNGVLELRIPKKASSPAVPRSKEIEIKGLSHRSSATTLPSSSRKPREERKPQQITQISNDEEEKEKANFFHITETDVLEAQLSTDPPAQTPTLVHESYA